MELRQLAYFVAVSEERNFSKAAARCFISQSAISHQIAHLEHDLEVRLFDRSTRTVTPTEAGERLLPLAKQMLALETAIHAAARRSSHRIRLAANMTFASQSLSAIAKVRAQHPDTEIEFVIKNFRQRIAAVVDGDCDLALIRGSVDQPGIDVSQLWVEDLIIATSSAHPLATKHQVTLAELAPYPLLLPSLKDQVLLHNVIRSAFAKLAATPNYGPPIPADHTATMDLLNRPDAWTVLYSDRQPDGIAFLTEADRRLRIPVSAAVRSGTRQPSVVRELLDALRGTSAE